MYGLIALSIAITLVVAGALYAYRRIGSVGKIRKIDVEVYLYANTNQTVDFIDWGWMSPGETKPFGCYVFNPSPTLPINITVWAENWIPSNISQYMNLTAITQQPYNLMPGEFTAMYLILTVDPDLPSGFDDFSLDIVVQGKYDPPEP